MYSVELKKYTGINYQAREEQRTETSHDWFLPVLLIG